jgi:hypothetical protein
MNKGYLYVMTTGGRCKVGLSVDPGRRHSQLKNAATPDLLLVATFPTDDMAGAEKAAHRVLTKQGHHYAGEMFTCCQDTAIAAVEFATNTPAHLLPKARLKKPKGNVDGLWFEKMAAYNAQPHIIEIKEGIAARETERKAFYAKINADVAQKRAALKVKTYEFELAAVGAVLLVIMAGVMA